MSRLDPIEAVAAFERGEIAILPTDTLPGLHGLATIDAVADRLATLKGHRPNRPYLLLVGTVEAAFRIGQAASAVQEARLEELWPGPLTALLRPEPGVPARWVHEGRSVALRVPGRPALLELLSGLSGPLFSTSVNRAGEAPATDLAGACAAFPDLDSVDFEDAREAVGAASTIVDCTVDPAVLVRASTIAF